MKGMIQIWANQNISPTWISWKKSGFPETSATFWGPRWDDVAIIWPDYIMKGRIHLWESPTQELPHRWSLEPVSGIHLSWKKTPSAKILGFGRAMFANKQRRIDKLQTSYRNERIRFKSSQKKALDQCWRLYFFLILKVGDVCSFRFKYLPKDIQMCLKNVTEPHWLETEVMETLAGIAAAEWLFWSSTLALSEPLKTNMVHLKIIPLKSQIILQTSIFRFHVGFQGSKLCFAYPTAITQTLLQVCEFLTSNNFPLAMLPEFGNDPFGCMTLRIPRVRSS